MTPQAYNPSLEVSLPWLVAFGIIWLGFVVYVIFTTKVQVRADQEEIDRKRWEIEALAAFDGPRLGQFITSRVEPNVHEFPKEPLNDALIKTLRKSRIEISTVGREKLKDPKYDVVLPEEFK